MNRETLGKYTLLLKYFTFDFVQTYDYEINNKTAEKFIRV